MAENERQNFKRSGLLIDDLFINFLKSVRFGENKLQQVFFKEDLTFNEEWINTIDDYLFSVEKISKNPMKFIKDQLELTVIEKAKKISNRTMQHLASHSRDVRSFENGKISPKKVLTKHMEEDIQVYENRVIYTLINRLIVFMEMRYRKIKKSIDANEITKLNVNSVFKVGENDVKCELNLEVKEPKYTDKSINNKELLEKIERIRKRLRIIQATSFYKVLSKTKPLNPPIVKTNVLLMNRDYNNAYRLWLFISSYRETGFTVDVTEKQFTFDKDYYDDLTSLVALGFRTMVANNALRAKRYAKIKARARRTKRYHLNDKIVYEGNFRREKIKIADDFINEYYYEAIKKHLRDSDVVKEEEIVLEELKSEDKVLEYEKKLDISFRKFFNAIMKINNSLFDEKLDINHKREAICYIDTEPELKSAITRQRTRYRKFKQLSTLKLQDISIALKREGDELLALKLLAKRLAKLKGKSYEEIVSKENFAEYKEVMQKANKLIESIDLQTDDRLEKALLKEQNAEIRERVQELNRILQELERDVDYELVNEFKEKIKEKERKEHFLNKTIEEKEKLIKEKLKEIENINNNIKKLEHQANNEYLAKIEALELRKKEMQVDLNNLEQQNQAYIDQELEKLELYKQEKINEINHLIKETNKDIAKREQTVQEFYESEKLRLIKEKDNQKTLLEKLQDEHKSEISQRKKEIEAAYNKQLIDIEKLREKSYLEIEQKEQAVLKEKEIKEKELEKKRLDTLQKLDIKLKEVEREIDNKTLDLENVKKKKLEELNKKLENIEWEVAKRENEVNEIIEKENKRVEEDRGLRLSEILAKEKDNKEELDLLEREINEIYDEEYTRLEILREDKQEKLNKAENEIYDEYKTSRGELTRIRRAYRKEIRDSLSSFCREKDKIDNVIAKLIDGSLSLYPADNTNRLYKFVYLEKGEKEDLRKLRVTKKTSKLRAKTERKWQR